MVWYGMVWCGMVWYGMVWYGMVWYGMVWYGMVWCGVVWCGMVWYGMVWYSAVWHGVLCYMLFHDLLNYWRIIKSDRSGLHVVFLIHCHVMHCRWVKHGDNQLKELAKMVVYVNV